MKVVILCGGQGTRLREETEVRPKPRVESGNRPILRHLLKRYSHFTVRLGENSGAECHSRHPEDGWTVTLADTGQSAMTGARVRRVRRYLDRKPFCLTYGDGLGDVNIPELLKFRRSHRKPATVTGVRPPRRFGELMMWPHEGFRQPRDTFRERKLLEDCRNPGHAPWKVWE